MNTETNVSILAAIAAALYGAVAAAEAAQSGAVHVDDVEARSEQQAEEKSRPITPTQQGTYGPPQRERVDWAEWRESLWRRKEPTKQEWQRYWWVGFGGEGDVRFDMSDMYAIRRAQREATPLQYLEPLEEHEHGAIGGLALFAGVTLNSWLDLEIGWHGLDSYMEITSYADVFDPTLPSSVQDQAAQQYSYLDEQMVSLTFLPHWDVTDNVSVYGRIGAGYMDTRLTTEMSTTGWVSSKQVCETDSAGRSVCRNVREYAGRIWGEAQHDRTKIIPVAGVGIRFYKFLRFEYLRRFDAPVGEGTTDITTGHFFLLSMTSTFLSSGINE
jgi:opacity protein-like surface antigen